MAIRYRSPEYNIFQSIIVRHPKLMLQTGSGDPIIKLGTTALRQARVYIKLSARVYIKL